MIAADLSLSGWSAISTFVLAITTALALVGVAVQIRLARATTKQTLTYNYTERFAKPELLPFHQKTRSLFNLGGATADERFETFANWSTEDQLGALLVPNLFEELAGMYNQGLLHRRITKEYFGRTAHAFWDEGEWFILALRASYPRYYEQWERMLRDMGFLPKDGCANAVVGGAICCLSR